MLVSLSPTKRSWLPRGGLVQVLAALLVMVSLAGCSQERPAARPLTYVALGASDAVGMGAPEPERNGWVPKLGVALGPNTRVVNLGVNGSTLSQALQEQLEPALAAEPSVVTVWLAVNDFIGRVPLDRYTADLDRLLARLDSAGARVLVGNVPDLSAVSRGSGMEPARLQSEIARWNEAIARATARHNAQVVDLYTHWPELAEHPEYISADGFHPSAAGYSRLAQIFAEAYADYRR